MSLRIGLSAALAALAAAAPATVATAEPAPRSQVESVIGESVRGRAIEVRRVGDPSSELKVLVVGSIHGDERQGHRVIRRLRGRYGERIRDADIWTITTVNPDGVAAGRRGNARGVDLNRNFSHGFDPTLDGGYESGPRPFSEPEARAVKRLSKRVGFDLAVWYHQPWGQTLVPCNSSRPFAMRYSRVSGLEPMRECEVYAPGSAISWQRHRFGTVSFVVELPGRRLHAGEVRRNARATLAVTRMLKDGDRPAADPFSAARFRRATAETLRSPGFAASPPESVVGRTPAVEDAHLFPRSMLLTLYGAPQLGGSILGQKSPSGAARKLVRQARAYDRKTSRPIIPGFDLVTVVTNSTPGPDGLYRTRQPDRIVRTYLRAARSVDGRLMLDIQPGRARIIDEVEALEPWLAMPDVDLAIDPEWNLGRHELPGETNGGMSARELNRVSKRLQEIVDTHDLPPKVLVVHQFHGRSVRQKKRVRQRRDVDVTLSFDGGGSPSAKQYGYEVLSAGAPFTGFSIFYAWDSPIMGPGDVLRLEPEPDFLMFQ